MKNLSFEMPIGVKLNINIETVMTETVTPIRISNDELSVLSLIFIKTVKSLLENYYYSFFGKLISITIVPNSYRLKYKLKISNVMTITLIRIKSMHSKI